MGSSGGPTVGIDIGSRYIKAVELAPGRNGATVRALGIGPTPAEAVDSGIITDPKALGAAVKQLLKSSGISTRRSVSSVAGQGALVVRVIEVPRMSDSELAETMRWEVERHVPFAADEVIMDFQAVPRSEEDGDSENMEVLMAVAQQEMVDRHVTMLYAAGLRPAAIDVEPLAAARALIELGPDPYAKKTTAIVNIGASCTDVGIFRDGVLAFPRTLPLAGDTMTNAVMQQLQVDEEQAEELKTAHGSVLMSAAPAVAAPPATEGFYDLSAGQPDTSSAAPIDFDLGEPSAEQAESSLAVTEAGDDSSHRIFMAIAPILAELVAEIRRSIEYYTGRVPDGSVDEILLCGGTAGLKNLDQFLSAELGVPTRVADAFKHTTVSTRNYSAEDVRALSPSFAVAVGLAARDMIAVPARPRVKPAKRGKK